MNESRDPQRIAAFLMAGWKGLVGLEEAVEGLQGQESDAARKALSELSRELAGSAETYGFYGIARLAASMERLANAFPPLEHSSAADILQLLGDTLTVFPMVLDNIAAEGSEDIPQVPGLQWRYDVEVPAAEELAAQRRRAQAPGPVDAQLERLRRAEPEMVGFFVADARQHLAGMESRLARLRSLAPHLDTADIEILNDFFRHAHTIKGAAYTVGCHAAGDLAHGMEDILVGIRSGEVRLNEEILEVGARCASALEAMADRLDGRPGPAVQPSYDQILRHINDLRPHLDHDVTASSTETAGQTAMATVVHAVEPTSSAPGREADPESAEARPTADSEAIHPGSAEPKASALKPPSELTIPEPAVPPVGVDGLGASRSTDDPFDKRYLDKSFKEGRAEGHDPGDLADDHTPVPPVSVPSISFAAEDAREVLDSERARSTLRVDLGRLESVLDLAGEVTVAHGTSVRQLAQLEGIQQQLEDCRRRMSKTTATFQQRHLNPMLESRSQGPEPDLPPVPGSEGPAGRTSAGRTSAGRTSAGRSVAEQFAELEFDRYDDFNILARRIGELSSDLSEIHHELEHMLSSARHSSLQVQSLTRRLRVGIGRVRMVPVGRLFARFSRLGRKAAAEASKDLEIELSGENVEIDNAVIERVAEPLTHLVQNAIHHGIESPDTRRMIGKEPTGTLRFAARAKGRRVRLEVSDDGAGIDLESIKKRALELGLRGTADLEALSDREALDLIYLPGLTTSQRVTTSAGRGVGMDAVRHSVNRLGGDILVESEPGAGTRFILELPASLLVTEALVVRAGDASFALPLPQVDRLGHLFEGDLRVTAPADDTPGSATEIAHFAGRDWPVLRLAERLGLVARGPVDEVPGLVATAALVRSPSATALIVDEVVGIEELVVKPLGPFLAGAHLFNGATLDTRGNIILMLDLTALVTGETLLHAQPTDAALSLPEAPPRVLLADDSLSVRRVLGRVLQKEGYEVFTARDGAEALELLLDLPFDAVITDLEMPRMSGYELIDDLRNRASTKDTPVWVVTTRAGARHAALAKDLGAVGYLAKPVDAELLVGQLESIVGRGRQL